MAFHADHEREEIEAQNERAKEKQKLGRLRGALDAFGNIFGLNVCFVLFSLPVVTMGASFVALYSMSMRLQEGKEATIFHGFLHQFKKNFKQATAAWLIMLVYAFVMWGTYVMVNNIPGTISSVYTVVLVIEAVFFCLTVPFVFPLIACYENTLPRIFKNSLLLAIGYLGSWIKVFIAWFAPIAFCLIYPILLLYIWYLWLLLLFGAIAWGTSYTIRKMFQKNMGAQDKTAEIVAKTEREKAEKQKKKKPIEKEGPKSLKERANVKT